MTKPKILVTRKIADSAEATTIKIILMFHLNLKDDSPFSYDEFS